MSGPISGVESLYLNFKPSITSPKIIIPSQQRPYEWDDQVIDDFFTDLTEAFLQHIQKYPTENPYDYFYIGSLIFCANKKERFVIDGQQRMVTFHLASLAIDRLVTEETVKADKSTWKKDLRYFKGTMQKFARAFGKDQAGFKIGFQTKDDGDDWEKFRNSIIDIDVANEDVKHKRKDSKITKKYKIVKRRIEEMFTRIFQEAHKKCGSYGEGSTGSQQAEIQAYEAVDRILSDFIENQIVITPIVTDDFSESFKLFENFNAKRTPLSGDSLIKNLILMVAHGEGQKDYKASADRWSELEHEVSSMTNFIRTYWNSKNDFITINHLYQEFQNYFKSDEDKMSLINSFIEGLEECLETYKLLTVNDQMRNEYESSNTSDDTKSIIEIIFRLHLRGNKTFYPLIIAINNHKKTTESEREKLTHFTLEFLESIYYYCSLLGVNPNSYEKKYAEFGVHIHSEQNYKAIKDYLKKEFKKLQGNLNLKTDNLKDAFHERSFSVNEAKSVLFKVEIQNWKNSIARIPLDSGKIHLEHIMPKKLSSSSWPGISDHLHKTNLNKFGNLLLLSEKLNTSIQNSSFKSKVVEFNKSENKDTLRKFLKYLKDSSITDKWTPKQIDVRTNNLFDAVNKAFSFDNYLELSTRQDR